MSGVGIPRLPGLQDLLTGHQACRVFLFPVAELGTHPLDAAVPQLADDLAALRQIGVKAQKVNAVADGKDLGFLIQLQPQTVHVGPYLPEAELQIFLVRVDEEKVIHVAAIVLDVELFLDEVVKVIQEQEGKEL